MSDRPGFFARLRNLFAAPPAGATVVESTAIVKAPAKALALPATHAPRTGEVGVDGIAIWEGQIIAESNQKLLYEAAYGKAGTRTWGEWEKFRRTDEAVAKALNFVMGPIRAARVDLEVPDKKLNPNGEAQVEFIRWVIDNLDPGWPEFLTQTGEGSLSTGFAIHEEVWNEVAHDALPTGIGWGLTKFSERLPSSIHFNGWIINKQTGELEGVRQNAPDHGMSWVTPTIPASKILLNTWSRNGNNFQGYSAFRPVFYPLLIRRELSRIMAIGHMRESLGVPVAYAEKDAKPLTIEQRASLSEFMQNCVAHENANIIMPQGWKLDWLWSKNADKGHLISAFNELGLFVLEQLGAQQLYLGTSGTGARAVGDVHANQATISVETVCSHLAACFNGVGSRPYTGFIRKLVDYNWGPQKAYPKISLTPRKPQLKVGERMAALKTAKDAGLITVTLADENAAREALELEPIDEATRDAERDAALERQQAMQPQLPASPGQKALPAGGPPKKFSAGGLPHRALRPSERVLDLAALEDTLDRGREDFAQLMKPLVAKLIVQAMPQVRAAMADGDPSEVATMPLDMAEVTNACGRWIEELRAKGYAAVQGERLRGGAPIRFAAPKPKPSPSAVADKATAALRKQVARRMEARIRGELESSAGDVIRTRGEPEEVVARVMTRQLETRSFEAEGGSVLARAFNVGREEYAEANGDAIESVELSAILDRNTCPPCERLDGTEFEFNSDEHKEHVPPMTSICYGADNDRCLLVYNFKR